ncbi:hypothetical protein KQI84_06120 [bacterium]|nr:hypothetical protein [bacterium]
MMRKEMKAGLTLIMALLLSSLLIAADGDTAPAKEVGIIVTHDAGRAWRPLGAPEDLDGAKLFEEALDEIAGDFPEDLKISLGGFTTGALSGETAYNSDVAGFYSSRDYDAVNVTAADYRNFAASGMGLTMRAEDDFNRYLSSLNPKQIEVPMPATKTVEARGHKIKFMSASDFADLSGFTDLASYTAAEDPADILASALPNFDGTSILLSDLSPTANDEIARQFGDLDLILEGRSTDGSQRKMGSTIIQATDRPGMIERMVLKYGDDGEFSGVEMKGREWISEENYAALRTISLPIIGMSVQPPERVTTRFDVKAENVQIDVHRDSKFPDLTTRENIYVYHLNVDGNEFHFYRVYHRFAREEQRAWIPVDMLVLINPDHTIRGIETNLTTYPLDVFSTKMGTVLKDLYGKPPAEWEVNADLIRGYEESAALIVDDLRKTLELDMQLYPSGYLEAK